MIFEPFRPMRGGMEMRRKVIERGRYYEDFSVGDVYPHHWGKTITQAEAVLFSNWTMNANPLHFNQVYARSLGHPEPPLHPLHVMNVVFGMSVEDLSEQALAHLGYWKMRFPHPAYPGDTLFAESRVLDKRESESKSDRGIIHVETVGRNQDGKEVIRYERKILVKKRAAHPPLDRTPGARGGA